MERKGLLTFLCLVVYLVANPLVKNKHKVKKSLDEVYLFSTVLFPIVCFKNEGLNNNMKSLFHTTELIR